MEVRSRGEEIEFKTVFNEDGSIKFVKKEDVDRGKKSKRSGGTFELRVRRNLEEKGWIVDKWSNNIVRNQGFLRTSFNDRLKNVEDEWKLVPCKRKFNPFNRVMGIGTGFPDFVCFSRRDGELYKVIGVEVKMNGNLSRVEKEKCVWYLERGIFSEILVASKKKEGRRVVVEYADVGEILERMRAS